MENPSTTQSPRTGESSQPLNSPASSEASPRLPQDSESERGQSQNAEAKASETKLSKGELAGPKLSQVVESLYQSAIDLAGDQTPGLIVELPSRDAVFRLIEDLRSVLFPGFFGTPDLHPESLHYFIGSTLAKASRNLFGQVRRALAFASRHETERCPRCEERAEQVTQRFMARLPEVRRLLATDVEAAYEGDPALTLREEAVFSYPGVLAITNQRLAHELHKLEVPIIPRLITERAHTLTGIDIHPGARIGERFFIDHGTGVVIGETSVVGNGVRLYQGVTLGARSFPLDEEGHPIKGIDRHPVVEDNVVIYAGATVLGRITVGKGSEIGGNVWLTRSVPPGSRVSQAAPRETGFERGGGI